MSLSLVDSIALLERTPASLNALLRDLPATWTHRNEGGNSWTAYDIVGHLAYGEKADWLPRVKMILEHGENRTFVPFDREGQNRESQGRPLPDLLDEFARQRAANLDQLRGMNLTPQDLQRRGTHPVFGSVTMSELLATWVAHDLTHLHQLSRVLAYQYRDAVGPWTVFLGVLKCEGHSEAPKPPTGEPAGHAKN